MRRVIGEMKRLLVILCVLFVLAGCSSMTSNKTGSYPSTVAWHNILYGLSATEVTAQDIGKQIGQIERRVAPMPKKNGDANDKPVGSLLFEIKGIDVSDVIAVKVNDTYFRASKMGPLQ